MKTIKINDNISLHYVPMEKLKTTAIGLYVHHDLNRTDATKTALLPYVLRRGSAERPTTGDIARSLEDLYGAHFQVGITKKGNDHILIFDGETISDRYAPNGEKLVEQTVELILSCIFNPKIENGAFSEDYVQQEKANLRDRIQNMINDKASYAMLRCTEEMFKGDVFAVPQLGCIEDVDKITAGELYEYYKKMIVSSVIDIYICGDTDINGIESAVKNSISGFTFEKAALPEQELLVKDNSEVNKVTDKLDVTQGKLSMGFRTNISSSDKLYWGLMAANSVFGGGAHSKLFNNVREKLSLAYYASSQLNRSKGLMFVNAGIEFKNFNAAYDEIMAQFNAVKNGDISDDEINASVQAIVTALNSYYDDGRAIQGFFLNEKVAGTNRDIAEVREQIQQVTKDDIVRAAKQIELDTVYFLTGREAE